MIFGIFHTQSNSKLDKNFSFYDCCLVPICHSENSCFQAHSCGPICNPFISRSTRYKLSKNYKKLECLPYFSNCRIIYVDCSDCPSPNENNFSIRFVSKKCINCYYK